MQKQHLLLWDLDHELMNCLWKGSQKAGGCYLPVINSNGLGEMSAFWEYYQW